MNKGLETVVRRLFADEEFRAAAINEPATLEEYGLSEFEKRSVGMICQSFTSTPGTSRGLTPLSWF